jgi:hypothetical protein
MMEEEKLKKWKTMEFSEKQKFNGYRGFCNNEYFSETNAFIKEDKEKLEKRRIKELERRHNEK